VAAPTKTVPHPGRALLALVVLFLIMLLSILGGSLFSPGHWHKNFQVGLGLDLSSGTQVTMKAQTLSGAAPQPGELTEASNIILARVNGTGNSGASVSPEGSDLLVVSVPGKSSEQTIALVSTTALLRFRQVLLLQEYGATATPTTTPSATPSSTASPSASASTSATPKVSASASATSTASTSAKIVPDVGASASPTATASPKATGTASPTATASPSPSASPTASVSSTANGDASLVNKSTLALFNKLTCKPGESDSVWKAQVGYTKSGDYDNPDQQIVSCDASGNKYALDVAKVLGEDVTNAQAAVSTTNNEWQVNLTLNSKGAAAFSALTSAQFSKYGSDYTTNPTDGALNQIAIVLDGTVVTSAETQSAIPGGNVQITGSFTQAQATQLQNVLKYGSLPLSFSVQYESSVSPTVGKSQLDGGLIAAAIGLALVVLYSFLYYRGLGLVSVSSLIISATITYLSVVLLTKYQSFHLELSGIAGLIVAIGITADSFVVFFERLRDEVREGKQLRPAVEAGWKRARRTILVSDTVSFLAAVLLYYFAIGEVKGFAYTLGLTTLIDVIVVFLFTKPMVTLLARTRFYGNGHPLSGLDPARLGARTGWRSSVRRTQVRRRPDTVARTTESRTTDSRTTGSRTTGSRTSGEA
jgi:preprotein translocase subunit SecD